MYSASAERKGMKKIAGEPMILFENKMLVKVCWNKSFPIFAKS